MDPLEEPEVLLVKNSSLKEKDQTYDRQSRKGLQESKRKSQNKKILEKDVKQEPVDIDSIACKDGTTNEIEVRSDWIFKKQLKIIAKVTRNLFKLSKRAMTNF